MEGAEVLKLLITKHYELIAIHYYMEDANEAHWRTITYHTSDLHQLVIHLIGKSFLLPMRYVESIQQLIVSHWQLWQTHNEALVPEPPAYLVDAIDYVERNYPTCFSYQESRWIEA